jgi:hypothetical protein
MPRCGNIDRFSRFVGAQARSRSSIDDLVCTEVKLRNLKQKKSGIWYFWLSNLMSEQPYLSSSFVGAKQDTNEEGDEFCKYHPEVGSR